MDHGHSHAAILDYTLGQFEAYARAAQRREHDALRTQLITARAGQWGDTKQFQTLLQLLHDD